MAKKDKNTSLFDNLLSSVKQKISKTAHYIPDILTACESADWLNITNNPSNPIQLYPLQRIALTCFYRGTQGNENIKITEEDYELLKKEKMEYIIDKYESPNLYRQLTLVWGRRCISEHSQILNPINNSYTSVGSLWDNNVRFTNTYSFNEKTKELCETNAEIIYNGIKQVYRITLTNGNSTDATDNHPFYTPTGWKKLSELTITDTLAVLKDNGLEYIGIQSIEKKSLQRTFDLSVQEENCHNFIVDNILAKNSGKNVVSSVLASYEAIRLLEVPGGNPFTYYKIKEGNPIYITTVAGSDRQAKILFNEIKTVIMNSPYFQDKIGDDGKAMDSQTIHLLTPHDKEINKEREANGLEKTRGSIVILSGHSNSDTLRGNRTFCLLLDEVSKYKTTTGASGGETIYNALAPSTNDFKVYYEENGVKKSRLDSKIIAISSPRGKEGIFYRMFAESFDAEKGKQSFAMRAPTWKVNLQDSEENCRRDFPLMSEQEFAMEFGAEFAGLGGEKFIADEYIDRAINLELGQREYGEPGVMYYAHIDPAATSNNYAMVILHVVDYMKQVPILGTDKSKRERSRKYIIDHIKVWTPKIHKAIDFSEVDNYVIGMSKKFRFAMVSYDSFESRQSMQKLRRAGVPVKITQFRSRYKMYIYKILENLLICGDIILPANGPHAKLLEAELKNLRRVWRSNGFAIQVNTESDCKTDDVCVDPETLVITLRDTCEIKDVNPGDFVLTHTGHFKQVTHTSFRKTKQKSYSIQPFYGFTLKATANHPIEIYENGTRKWKKAGLLTRKDWIVRSWYDKEREFKYDLANFVKEAECPRHRITWCSDDKIRSQNPNSKWINRFISNTNDFGYLVGLYLSEGSLGNHGISFGFNINEHNLHTSLIDCCQNIFGIKPSGPWKQEDTDGCNMALDSTIVKEFFIHIFGTKIAIYKTIPTVFLCAPIEFQKHMLKGIFDGDGNVDGTMSIRFTTASDKLALDIQNVLLRLGIISSIKISRRKGKKGVIRGREINHNADLYDVNITEWTSYNKLAEICNVDLRKKRYHCYQPQFKIIEKNTIACKIRKIKDADLVNVCNLTVAEDSSYIAGSINTHNCDAVCGALGVAEEQIISGYAKSDLAYLPVVREGGNMWHIGQGAFTTQQFNFMDKKFGIGTRR